MFRTLFLMLFLLAGLIAGPYLAGKQGYVLIETASTRYELTITFLIILFVIAMAVIYSVEWLFTRFFRLSNNTYSWFSRRKRLKAQRQTLEGLMKMGEGDYSKAEKLMGKNAKHADEPVLNFLKAAEAAQQRGDEFNANRYLMQATEQAGGDSLIVEIARTRILLLQNKLPAARSSIDSLLVMTSRNVEVLKLAVKIYLKSKAYTALDNILDRIEASGLYNSQQFLTLQRQVEDGLLDEKMNEEGQEGLLAWWQDQPRKRRNDLYVKIGLIERLIECNDHETAYELTLEALKKVEAESENGRRLCAQIARLQPTDAHKLIKQLEKRAGECCCYNRALGYLYVRNAQFDKAANAFEKVMAQHTELEPYDTTIAAYAFEQIGDHENARKVREIGLKSAMGTHSATAETVESAEKNPNESTALLEQKA